jgi:uncharacterized protein (TIGR02996 family)
VDQEASLRAAICANPDDLDVRRVFADWLEDAGQLERAELIRVQCELDGLAGDHPRRPALEMREEELLVAREKEWQAEVPAWVRKYARFRCGFVTEVKCGVRGFVTKAGALLKRSPVTDFRLGEVGKQVADLAACPHLAAVRDLRLVEADSASLTELQHSPHLGKLQGLHLEGFAGYTTGANLASLLATPLPALAAFSLHNLMLWPAENVDPLLTYPPLARVERLKFYNNVLEDRGAERLAAIPTLANLRELDLGGCWGLTDVGLAALAASPYLANVERLYLGGARGVTDTGLRSLAESPYMSKLTDLGLSFTSITDAGLELLIAAPRLPHLTRLDLFGAKKINEKRWKPWRSRRDPNLYIRCLWVPQFRQARPE